MQHAASLTAWLPHDRERRRISRILPCRFLRFVIVQRALSFSNHIAASSLSGVSCKIAAKAASDSSSLSAPNRIRPSTRRALVPPPARTAARADLTASSILFSRKDSSASSSKAATTGGARGGMAGKGGIFVATYFSAGATFSIF